MQTVAVTGFDQVVLGNPLGCDRKDGLWAKVYGRWFKISANRTPVPSDFPVRPAMIVSTHFTGVFGRLECECFAAKLVHLAQKTGGWDFFTADDLNRFDASPFNGENLEFFTELGFLNENNGRYSFTQGFVMEVLGAQ